MIFAKKGKKHKCIQRLPGALEEDSTEDTSEAYTTQLRVKKKLLSLRVSQANLKNQALNIIHHKITFVQ
jgi:alanine dehydrogenase